MLFVLEYSKMVSKKLSISQKFVCINIERNEFMPIKIPILFESITLYKKLCFQICIVKMKNLISFIWNEKYGIVKNEGWKLI